jgi:hypothetical protein
VGSSLERSEEEEDPVGPVWAEMPLGPGPAMRVSKEKWSGVTSCTGPN